MEALFGSISPALLMAFVTMITEFIKRNYPELKPRQIQLVALGLSFLFLVPYHIITGLTANPDPTLLEIAWLAFGALVYPIGWWLAAIGLYEVVIARH